MLALCEMVIQGVSTRKVEAITEVLCGAAFSKSQVSKRLGAQRTVPRQLERVLCESEVTWIDRR